jgi:hypothetical protein
LAAQGALAQASMSLQVVGLSPVQWKPVSTAHIALQPSPSAALPSSHFSMPVFAPSPQWSPQSWAQLAVVSSPLHAPSPQLGLWQRPPLQTLLSQSAAARQLAPLPAAARAPPSERLPPIGIIAPRPPIGMARLPAFGRIGAALPAIPPPAFGMHKPKKQKPSQLSHVRLVPGI